MLWRLYLSPEITHLWRLPTSGDYLPSEIIHLQWLPTSRDYSSPVITHLWSIPFWLNIIISIIITIYLLSQVYIHIFLTNVSEAQCFSDDCLWFSSDLENARFWLSAISWSMLLLDTPGDLWTNWENARFWLPAIFWSMLLLGALGDLWADWENARFLLPAIFRSMLLLGAPGDYDPKYTISSTCKLTKRISCFGF